MNDGMVPELGLRVGIGYDVHAFAEQRPLILGGRTIPHTHGLAGHSDADVLAHAITDALLGAAGLGDIGRHFPDDDPRYRDADSIVLLEQVVRMLAERRFSILNVDSTVIAQRPKLAPHIEAMRATLARALGVDPARVNVKATTNERLGFVGREEGIAALAVCLLQRQP